jgi:hypothetical protein
VRLLGNVRFWRRTGRFLAIFFVYRAVIFGVHAIADRDGALIVLSALLVPFAVAFAWLGWHTDGGDEDDRRSSGDTESVPKW